MAIYLGNGEKLKVMVGNSACSMDVFSKIPVTNGIRLLSSDGYVLKDSKGLYLTTKEVE